jgi:hypothetical protein
MTDFNLLAFADLVEIIKLAGFYFIPLESISFKTTDKSALIRHDIDKNAYNALNTAAIEHNLGVKGSYYFRVIPESNHPNIIEKIASLGHEIGYHYEDLALCKGDMDAAIRSFKKNLNYFRQFYPVKTICMHGSPLSKFDNRKLWEKYNYRDFGIEMEPYFDVDYTKVLYLTDTGRKWDGERVSVRDKVSREYGVGRGGKSRKYGVLSNEIGTRDKGQETNGNSIIGITQDGKLRVWRDEIGILKHNFHTTFDIIRAVEEKILPDQIMITVHPQRWTNNPVLWTKELLMQTLKNQVKRMIVK